MSEHTAKVTSSAPRLYQVVLNDLLFASAPRNQNVAGDWLHILDATDDMIISFDQGAAIKFQRGDLIRLKFSSFAIAPAFHNASCELRIGQGGLPPVNRLDTLHNTRLISLADVAFPGNGVGTRIWPGLTSQGIIRFSCSVDVRYGDINTAAPGLNNFGVLLPANTIQEVDASNALYVAATSAAAGFATMTLIQA